MCNFCKITEYLAFTFGVVLLGGMFIGWALSGVLLKVLIGITCLLLLFGGTFIVVLREILYWAGRKSKKKTASN